MTSLRYFGLIIVTLVVTNIALSSGKSTSYQQRDNGALKRLHSEADDLTPRHSRLVRAVQTTENLLAEDAKQQIVDLHNKMRRQEESSNMKNMYWHDGLATQAREWADGCDFEHGGVGAHSAHAFDEGVGQNLGFQTHVYDPLYIIQQWYDEKPNYDFENDRCMRDICGHYTQVVWSDSAYVGCAFVRCQPLSESSVPRTIGPANYLVCNYGPPGNYAHTRPYAKGPSCTDCASGSYFCDQGLCRDCVKDGINTCDCKAECGNCGSVVQASCTCKCQDGYLGAKCTETCSNNHDYCNSGWYTAQCSGYDYVRNNCPLMCGICAEPTGPCKSVNSATTTVSYMTTTETTEYTTTPDSVAQSTSAGLMTTITTKEITSTTDQFVDSTTEAGLTTTGRDITTTSETATVTSPKYETTSRVLDNRTLTDIPGKNVPVSTGVVPSACSLVQGLVASLAFATLTF